MEKNSSKEFRMGVGAAERCFSIFLGKIQKEFL
jgi:hypothetical protein